MSVINANPLMLGDAGYNIGRSLRFRSSASAYLSRTPASASNRKTWTWSGWVKLGTASVGTLFGHSVDSNNFELFQILADGSIRYIVVSGGTNNGQRNTTRLLRDYSSWYHLVLSKDAASTAVNIYVNGGSAETSFSTNVAVANVNGFINNTVEHRIGLVSGTSLTTVYFDGYLAEVNFIDGQALTPSSFGQTDATTGVWVPKKYAGTYGTNGFYLPFSDNTSATTLAYDKSGNGNNWTPNNISTTSGATYDSMTDVPTLTSATAANFATMNQLDLAGLALSSANLGMSAGGAWQSSKATMAIPTSGQWYWEVTLGGANSQLGIFLTDTKLVGDTASNAAGYVYDTASGNKYNAGSGSAYGATCTTGDVVGVAFNSSTGTLTFYKNNVSQGNAWTGLSGQFSPSVALFNSTANINFGQRPFSYTPPTGFKALNTFNLPDPTIKKPNQYMDAALWTGDGSSTRTISGVNFQPDFIWTKSRSIANYHNIYDSVRGFGTAKSLNSNSTDSEGTYDKLYGYVSAATTSGFSVANGTDGSQPNAYTNQNGITYVGWQWKKGATPGFDIVTYTGTGANLYINHSLGVAPAMYIIKNRTSAGYNWFVYHKSLGNNGIWLNGTGGSFANSSYFPSYPNSTQFSASTDASVNQVGSSHVAYLFAEIAGFSKFGNYTGNGSADGPFVYCGFRPKYVMTKSSTSSSNWAINDSSRSPSNVSNATLLAENYVAESSSYPIDILSNGFKLRTTNQNDSGQTFIFMAFAENPFKYSNAR